MRAGESEIFKKISSGALMQDLRVNLHSDPQIYLILCIWLILNVHAQRFRVLAPLVSTLMLLKVASFLIFWTLKPHRLSFLYHLW